MLTGGAGHRAMARAFLDVFGVPDALAGTEMAGRTDSSILADALALHRIAAAPSDHTVFRVRYVECLREEVPRPVPDKRVLPGIQALLDALAPVPDHFLGLLTGNYAEAAEVKLSHFGLWRYFRCGAFGEDDHDRNALVPVALTRARAAGLPPRVDASRVVVIGDTPRDVACAHAHRARCIAVATGEYGADALRAAGADAVFDDLAETGEVLRVVESF